jgi:integrase
MRPAIVAALAQHRERQDAQRVALELGPARDGDLIFANADGDPIPPDAVTKAWVSFCRPRRLPAVHFHALRHTSASVLIARGMNIEAVSRRLGHASPMVTLGVYSHLFGAGDAYAPSLLGTLGLPVEPASIAVRVRR